MAPVRDSAGLFGRRADEYGAVKFLTGTTRADLNAAYLLWRRGSRRTLIRGFKSGVGVYGVRNNGLRFGQYFWNEYGAADESWPAFFYEENADKAYMLAFSELPEATYA